MSVATNVLCTTCRSTAVPDSDGYRCPSCGWREYAGAD
jgi:predicted RNA-binding Zn-ribbon protein involved in translation (DUF1610 family)